jgi:hypothetical protein
VRVSMRFLALDVGVDIEVNRKEGDREGRKEGGREGREGQVPGWLSSPSSLSEVTGRYPRVRTEGPGPAVVRAPAAEMVSLL